MWMAENKRYCKDCKHCKGIGYDFWCGEGHTEYEVFLNETNCPYYEFHDWSKGTPNRTGNKRFTWLKKDVYAPQIVITDSLTEKDLTPTDCYELLNELADENKQLKQKNSDLNNILLIQKGIIDDWEIEEIEIGMKILCDLYFSVRKEKEQLEQRIKEYEE